VVGAYLGLVPGESTTGGPNKRRLGSIARQGNGMARSMLVQAAWSILRACDRDDPLKRWAEHLANTRGKRIAVVTLARKLAGVLWAMCRDGTVYDPAEQAEKTAHGIKVAARNSIIEWTPSNGQPRSSVGGMLFKGLHQGEAPQRRRRASRR
jgi:hypothetical protein